MVKKPKIDWEKMHNLAIIGPHKKLEEMFNQLVKSKVLVFINDLPKKGKYTLYHLIDHATNLNPSIDDRDPYFINKKDAIDYMNVMYEKFNKNGYLSQIEIENGKIVD